MPCSYYKEKERAHGKRFLIHLHESKQVVNHLYIIPYYVTVYISYEQYKIRNNVHSAYITCFLLTRHLLLVGSRIEMISSFVFISKNSC